ncbi:MAG: FtsQ-type POTRA domain-containing protein [Oscillospiraceae bacterium]|nr:FtsQ-type POTRA domain-containing protein [Oscillospiraceae bacterium]
MNKRGRGIKLVLIAAAVIALLFAGFGMLFDINEILVDGAYEYTADEIIEASGIKTGSNLFFINTRAAESKITQTFPYISFASVTRELPGTVRIAVSEGIARAGIEFEGVMYLMDENCRITGEVEADDTYIEVIGLTVTEVKVGNVVSVDKSDETRLAFTQAVLNRLGDDGFSTYVTWLDVTNIGHITFDYLGRFTVNVGSGEQLEYKMSRIDGIISQLEETDTGLIDVSEEGKSYFEPSR